MKLNRKFLVIALITIMILSFVSTIPVSRAASPILYSEVSNTDFSGMSVSATLTPAYAGDNLIAVITWNGAASVSLSTFSDSQSNSFTKIGCTTSTNSIYGICAYYSTSSSASSDKLTASFSGTTVSTLQVYDSANFVFTYAVVAASDYLSSTCTACDITTPLLSSVEFTSEAVYGNKNQACSSATNVLVSSLNQLDTNSSLSGCYIVTDGYALNANIYENQLPATVVLKVGGSTVIPTAVALAALSIPQSGYSTTVVTYSISWTNATCASGFSSTCTQTTTWTIVSYDDTSTNITVIYCDSQTGCSHFTQNVNKTVTYTSAGYTTSTVTTTVTATAIVAPSSTSVLNWFFGFALLIIPPATFIGMFRGRGSTDLTTPLMVGLFVGALLSLLINIIVSGVGFGVIAFVFIWLWRSGKL